MRLRPGSRWRAALYASPESLQHTPARDRVVRDGKAWVVFACDGEPLDPEHGGQRGDPWLEQRYGGD